MDVDGFPPLLPVPDAALASNRAFAARPAIAG